MLFRSSANLDTARLNIALYDEHTQWPTGFRYQSSGAVGPGAVLNGAFLNTADLRGANLRGAKLMGAYLSGADLTGAILDDASLSGANLQRAMLTGASLREARVSGTELQRADLRASDLTGVEFDMVASIAGADFTMAQGLTPNSRGQLLGRSAGELDVWNGLTRNTTRRSLETDGAAG